MFGDPFNNLAPAQTIDIFRVTTGQGKHIYLPTGALRIDAEQVSPAQPAPTRALTRP